MAMRIVPGIALAASAIAIAAGCSGDDDSTAAAGEDATVVVSTSVLGDLVRDLVGDAATVEVLLEAGADPHDLALSPQQVASLTDADAIVINGLGLEAGIDDPIDAARAEGVPVFDASASARPLGEDPHFAADPDRMADVVGALRTFLEDEAGVVEPSELEAEADALETELHDLADEIDQQLAGVPDDRRLLVTSHAVLGYFADRFGFEVAGTILPGTSTLAEPSAADLSELAAEMEAAGVEVVFSDESGDPSLAEAVAAEVGDDVEVVPLYSESLGPEGSGADTYEGMLRTNAERIVEALG